MLTITYSKKLPELETWKYQLETLVMAHQIIQDENIEVPILKNTHETIIGEIAISKYIDELMMFQKAWFCNVCK